MAEAVDAAIAAGRGPGPLAGVPMPHKDMICRAGRRTACASLDTIGPLARSARDCAFVLATIAGADPADPHCDPRPVPDWLATIAPARRA